MPNFQISAVAATAATNLTVQAKPSRLLLQEYGLFVRSILRYHIMPSCHHVLCFVLLK